MSLTFTRQPGDPPVLLAAADDIGFHETGNNQGIGKFIAEAGCGSPGDPWCAISANAWFRRVGLMGTGSPAAISFAQSPNFVRISEPRRGAVCVFTRTGGNHVGLYTGEDDQGYLILGGNQSDQVCVEHHTKSGLVGFFWPANDATVAQPVQPQTATSVPAVSNFAACLPLLLVSEGGNDDDPRDPGGRTSRGITQREWDVWRHSHPDLPSDVWQAPDEQIRAIYRANYWNAFQCDQMPAGVDYAVFDTRVMSGHGIHVLQAVLGVDQDGEVGPITLAAIRKFEPAALIDQYQDHRLAYLQTLPVWGTFGHGWAGRVARVRKDSLAMAAKGKPMNDTTQTTQMPAIPGAVPQFDTNAMMNLIQQRADEARRLIMVQIALYNTINPASKINLAADAPVADKTAPPVAPAPAPSVAQPAASPFMTFINSIGGGSNLSFWTGIAAAFGHIMLNQAGLVGAPTGAAATTAGTLLATGAGSATLAGIFGKLTSIANALGPIAAKLGPLIALVPK